MKEVKKDDVIKALGLDFDTYEYYDDGGLILRYHKEKGITEAFDDETLEWDNSHPEFNIREKYDSPFSGVDVDMYAKEDEDSLIELAVSLVEWDESDEE